MDETTLETIHNLLEGALEEVDDTEARYKIKSAQQLLHVLQQRHDSVDVALEDVSDEDVIDNLRDLGYLS